MTTQTEPVRLAPILVSLVLLCSCAQPPDSDDVLGPSAAKAPAALTVKSVDPDSVPQDTTLDIRVFGTGFDVTAEAAFLLDGQPDPRVRTNSTRFVKPTEVVANVTVAIDAVPTLYDAQVTLRSNGKKGIGTEKLTVLAFADLGTFGGTRSAGFGVNDEGSVVGWADTTGNLGRAFVWDAQTQTMRNLGTLEAYGINNARIVVGVVAGIGPVRWVADGSAVGWASELLFSANPDGTFPTAINQVGQITGWGDHAITGELTGALIWQSPGVLIDLDPDDRWPGSQALSLNAHGWVVGFGRYALGSEEAWVWVPSEPNGPSGVFVVLPTFNGAPIHRAEGINDNGDIVGWAESAQGTDYPLLWRRNPAQPNPVALNSYLTPVNLGAALGRNGRAFDINNASKVVGRAHRSTNRFRYDPFVWDEDSGMRVLPAPPGGDAFAAQLNESGIATGSAMVSGNWHAIRWTLP